MYSPSMILDIILLVILIICALKGCFDGFFTALINLVGTLGSLICAWYVSRKYSQELFDKFIKTKLVKKSYEYLVSTTEGIDLGSAIEQIIGKWPEKFVSTIMSKIPRDLSQVLTPTEESAVTLVDTLIAPIVVGCIKIVIFLVIFVGVMLICKFLASFLKNVNKVPLIGTANRLAGLIVGTVDGSIKIVIISFVLCIFAIITKDSIRFINSEVIAGSKILAITGYINPYLP